MLFAVCVSFLTLVAAVAIGTPDRLRKPASLVGAAVFAFVLIWQADALSAPLRLLVTTAGMLLVVKFVALLRLHSRSEMLSFSPLGMLSYLTFWPGIDAKPLSKRSGDLQEDGRRFARGLNFALAGGVLALLTAMYLPVLGAAGSWLGIAALLLIVHFGISDMLTSGMRLCGWNVGPLFEEPFKSQSLREFWGKRWNMPFVEMDRLLFLPPLRKLLGTRGAVFGVFLISGLLHDVCISYSAGAGWGLPTLYFLLQGIAVMVEKRAVGKAPTFVRRLWTWLWLLAPLPLLFTEPFRNAFVQPLFQFAHDVVTSRGADWYLSLALWGAGIGHFCTLGAGLQVPFRLNWQEELSRVSTFNRKIFLNYAGYVGLMIIAFGAGTLLLHDEMMRGERAAVFLSGLIAVFWGIRLLVDFLWFGDKDWPAGPLFSIGHACLNALFMCLTFTYVAITLWHLWPHA
jgi:hypothetical protein